MAREMKDSGIEWLGYVPKAWVVRQLKSCVNVLRGGSPRPIDEYLTDDIDGLNWIKIGDTEKGKRYINSVRQKIKKSGLSKTRQVHRGDLLLTNSMSFGEPYILNVDGCIHDGWLVFTDIKEIDKEYLYYFLLSPTCKDQFSITADGGVVQNLNIEKVQSSIILLPVISEQHKIVDFLDSKCAEIDKAIEATKASIEEYKKLRQAIITEAVTKGLDPNVEMKDSGIEWIGEIPATWTSMPTKNMFLIGKGLSITKDNLEETGVPTISYGQIHAKYNTGTHLDDRMFRYVNESYLQSNKQSLVHKGCFVFADTSEDLEGCGNCVYADREGEFFAGYHTVTLFPKECEDNKYFAYLFRTNEWRRQIRSVLTEVKVYSVSQKIIRRTSIIIPPASEQKEICSYLDSKCSEIDSLIKSKEKLIEELTAYRKSLIFEYVTGKKEVPAV